MAKYIADLIMDAALNTVKNNATRAHICSDQPENYAGISSVELGVVTIDSNDFTGPANGDVSGRKLTFNQQTGVEIDTTGEADHLALSNGSDTLYLVTTLEAQTVTDGNTATINAFDWEIADVS